MKSYLGIDNGVSGALARVGPGGQCAAFIPTPTVLEYDYTKKAQRISRVHYPTLAAWLAAQCPEPEGVLALMERPFVNPMGFRSSLVSVRAFEVTLLALELAKIPHRVIDSKEWQKTMLPEGVIKAGGKELKRASLQRGIELFPNMTTALNLQGDADALLIAEWARRSNL